MSRRVLRTGIVATLLIAIFVIAMPVEAYTVAPSSGQSSPCNGWGLSNYLVPVEIVLVLELNS
jgi:hypothetical protein